MVSDVPELMGLMRGAQTAPQWSEAVWREMFAGEARRVVLAAEDVGMVGFVAGACVVDVAEVESVAVCAETRRLGVGRVLMEAFGGWAEGCGARVVELEVRASNEAAMGFYRALGFAEQGRRARYYAEPVEDAVLMQKTLSGVGVAHL